MMSGRYSMRIWEIMGKFRRNGPIIDGFNVTDALAKFVEETVMELESQVRDLTEERDKQAAKYREAMLALESLTPSGSEYVGDPKRCVEFVREARSMQHAAIVKFKLMADGLRDNVERLEREIRGARSYLLAMKDCPSRPTFCNCTGHTAMTNEIERQLHNRIRP